MNPTHHISDAAQMGILINEFSEYEAVPYSLYLDTDDIELADVGPFLVEIKANSKLLNWLTKAGTGNAWGIYINSDADFDKIVKHLQSFLIIEDEDGHEIYFRYYDPRVLKEFLPTCDSEQLKFIFGKIIKEFIIEDENPNEQLVFSLKHNKLITRKIVVEEEVKEKQVAIKVQTKFSQLKTKKKQDFDTII